MKYAETFRRARDGQLTASVGATYCEKFPALSGEIFFRMWDEADELVEEGHVKNVVTLDGGVLAALLMRDKSSRTYGVNMLAVGTGATGPLLAPTAADNRQRKLNAEIERKAFSSTLFRDANGVAVNYPTNIVDFTTIFGASEAVGPINELGLLSTISANPSVRNPNPNSFPTRDTTVDLAQYDVLLNYATIPVMSKQSGWTLSWTWRFTF